MYTLSIMILSYLYFKIFLQQKFPSSVLLLFFCFRQNRPTGPVDRRLCQDVHACACLSADRRVDRLSAVCSRVFWVDRPVDRLQKTVFLFRGRSTRAVDPSPTATASRADGRPDRLTAKPAEPQRLFPLLCISEICFGRFFLSCWRSFPDQISLK